MKRYFQSHFGLILSYETLKLVAGKEPLLSIPFWSDFIQSKTEEAYDRANRLSIPFWSDFIPAIKVAIILKELYFQSHFGLILSRVCGLNLHRAEPAFNPILVWFYQLLNRAVLLSNKKLSIPFWSDFILHCCALQPSQRLTFNPILVWFYHYLSFSWSTVHVFSFQSHFGLILSEQIASEYASQYNFQSHFGLILSNNWCLDV